MTDRAQELFEQTVDLSTTQRREALDNACGDDTTLRKNVEVLLAANDDAGSFMGNPTLDHVDAYSEPAEQTGTMIGRYKLLEKIGTGGFGDVYMAQQVEPVKRRVALKIIKLGMDTKQVVARFEAERQALALMDHPNIARVHDGGETKSGRPYFVMELVRGDPITTYCNREKISTRERLQLFQQVCQAIQHAHQKGIIHRDIKPTNVLITVADGKPLVKVIDFGIAKATNTELTDKTLFTEFRQLIGTPQYMSPEQAERSGVDIDTRSDIYSLGVLLYEMLTGQTPVDPQKMKTAIWEELQRMIREDEPTKPSALVTSLNADDSQLLAKSQGIQPNQLGTVLKGDLDWIILKSLEKDRTRRYGTASELYDDVDRYLNDEAVTATPPSTGYKLRKFARRNKAAIAVASALTAALLLGLIGTSISAYWAKQEQANAEQSAIVAEEAKQEADKARQEAVEASDRAEKTAGRAMRMAAVLASGGFDDRKETEKLAKAWMADIEEMTVAGTLTSKESLTQQCQLATWWYTHKGGSDAADLIEELYPRAKAELGIGDKAFFLLVNFNIVSHMGKYDAGTMADLFGELVESSKKLDPDNYEALLPQYSVTLLDAGRDQAATKAIDEYISIRTGPRPEAAQLEAMRLESSIAKLAEWGKEHPKRFGQLQDLLKKFKPESGDIFAVVASSSQTWEGTLDIGEAKLRLRFIIARTKGGKFSGKMISLDQGNASIPISNMSVEDKSVTIELAAANAKFVGTSNEQLDESVGKWIQGEQEYDFKINKVQD